MNTTSILAGAVLSGFAVYAVSKYADMVRFNRVFNGPPTATSMITASNYAGQLSNEAQLQMQLAAAGTVLVGVTLFLARKKI